jgi:hypothetical protein
MYTYIHIFHADAILFVLLSAKRDFNNTCKVSKIYFHTKFEDPASSAPGIVLASEGSHYTEEVQELDPPISLNDITIKLVDTG